MIKKNCMAVAAAVFLVGTGMSFAQSSSPNLVASGGSSPAPRASVDTRDERYRIGYRDKLTVQIFRHPELAQTVTVQQNGTINLFRLPEPVVAVCKTELELANDIAAAYKKDYLKNPEVQVVAAEQNSQAVSVVDAVVKPGPFFLNRRLHLWELIALAGGPSKEAGSRVIVARMGSTSNCRPEPVAADSKIDFLSFKISDLQEGKETYMIEPGDIVSVQKADIVFVYGNANEQGQVEMKQPLTLRQAIASAGGMKSATKSKVRIIRQKPGSQEPEEIVVDLNLVNKQQAPDPFLQPNDIVALSEDKTKSILNSVAKSFTQGLPSLLYRPY